MTGIINHTVRCCLSNSYLLQTINKKIFTSTTMFFRLIEVFMLRKQVGLAEVFYQNVTVDLFNRDYLFSTHSFFSRNATQAWRVS